MSVYAEIYTIKALSLYLSPPCPHRFVCMKIADIKLKPIVTNTFSDYHTVYPLMPFILE